MALRESPVWIEWIKLKASILMRILRVSSVDTTRIYAQTGTHSRQKCLEAQDTKDDKQKVDRNSCGQVIWPHAETKASGFV